MSEFEVNDVLRHYHSFPCGGHHGPSKTATKVLQSGFYWPSLFKDAHAFYLSFDAYQRTGNISKRQVGLSIRSVLDRTEIIRFGLVLSLRTEVFLKKEKKNQVETVELLITWRT